MISRSAWNHPAEEELVGTQSCSWGSSLVPQNTDMGALGHPLIQGSQLVGTAIPQRLSSTCAAGAQGEQGRGWARLVPRAGCPGSLLAAGTGCAWCCELQPY